MVHDEELEQRKVCKDLTANFATTFSAIITALRDMKAEDGSSLYHVHWEVCNTHEHGIPHHRERVYIVGLLASNVLRPFRFPATTSFFVPLGSILSDQTECEHGGHACHTAAKNIVTALNHIEANGGAAESEEWIINTGGVKSHCMKDLCPCITKRRGEGRLFFTAKRQRFITVSEMMLLQGVDPSTFRGWELYLSRPQMGAIVGNSMSLNVMERIVRHVLHSLGYPVSLPVSDSEPRHF